ncbi:hypothetical protein HJC23_007813 [Cyclotella cryptica]|uniref:Uncharacterized protein n=1 Tax=Cyclotella cryptica TaxID=29204 RepID=A0ABD3R0Q8_9STRA|eukprot:CCRYP_000092-RA/>CCRYP_000092-RA protein AED:0.12 eAED:0.12 QI:269/-1/1/1/-1/1/1/90/568
MKRFTIILIASLLHRCPAFSTWACNFRSTRQFVSQSPDVAIIDETCSDAYPFADYAAWPPNRSGFIEQQLNLCRDVIVKDSSEFPQNYATDRSRFKEHPRCTARFGEVLSHAYGAACTEEERRVAVENAEAVLTYVRKQTNGGTDGRDISVICDELIENVTHALVCPSVRNFRTRQLSNDEDLLGQGNHQDPSPDFVPEYNELQLLGRLYYSAIRSCEHCLREVGLSMDHVGFTVLLAFCRAAAAAMPLRNENSPTMLARNLASLPVLSKSGLKLDAALSNHFNGMTAPGCRFLFSPRHGLDNMTILGEGVRRRSKRLIIAFSSLGNGLVRFEFGGSLAKLNRMLHDSDFLDNETISHEDSSYVITSPHTFDVLFVADPSQSWYQKDSHGQFYGFEEYDKRLRLAAKPYSRISLVGDSMGGSATLLFSHLATESVLAFSPQVNLNNEVEGYHHVSRDDMTQLVREEFRDRLFLSVEQAMKKGVDIRINRGMEEGDEKHTNELMNYLSSYGYLRSDLTNQSIPNVVSTGKGLVEVREHMDCKHHQVAVHLKEKGQLVEELSFLVGSRNS